ncbi:MAG: YceK/YidQ family lipoprotein [Candidatus Omnitrophota bacterium]|nr:YceK/YidQ family lipoprotein [Candidatus Omnitrophota bacterium]MBU1928899.1 YceK/YidQ family lipoprotein [Candidatus Omnitrophota bacterium]MBU2034509.1 YceK/YidQ family lipoprotein [Candidatus Omnitrophota bacterium]MBU2221443.1 YceK/YidQ family lipoprotein [Candidatus Omnitrophota bacterium]MBU2258593.1 YceK/YidQ family lipoprotein [Candidatus Omnitrophota bacterium]
MKKIICCLFIVALMSGCASVLDRTDNGKIVSARVYPGVSRDVELMGVCSTDRSSYELASPQLTTISKLVFILALIDSPLSAVLDTILLPFDIFHPKEKKQEFTWQIKTRG